jgi:hypothetical protein
MTEAPLRIGVEFRMKNFGRVHPQASYIGDAVDTPDGENGDVEYVRADEVDRLREVEKLFHDLCAKTGAAT